MTGGVAGLSKGVGFVRFDRRDEAERAIQQLNGVVPSDAGGTLLEPLSVKFANSPSSSPLGSAAYAARHGLLGARGGPGGPGGLSAAAAAASLAAAAYLSPSCRSRLLPNSQHSANRFGKLSIIIIVIIIY